MATSIQLNAILCLLNSELLGALLYLYQTEISLISVRENEACYWYSIYSTVNVEKFASTTKVFREYTHLSLITLNNEHFWPR